MKAAMENGAVGQEDSLTSAKHPLLLFFDGECAFCTRWVNRVRLADAIHRMRFGTKQGATFQRVLKRHPELADVDSVILVKRDPSGTEKFLVRSEAILAIIQGLPDFWHFELVLRLVPTLLANLGYRIFSKLRTPLFGKWHHLRIPLENEKELFVD